MRRFSACKKSLYIQNGQRSFGSKLGSYDQEYKKPSVPGVSKNKTISMVKFICLHLKTSSVSMRKAFIVFYSARDSNMQKHASTS